MNRLLLPLLVIFLFAPGTPRLGNAREIPLKYEPVSEGIPNGNGQARGIFTSARPAGNWVLPPSLSAPRYAVLTWASEKHLLVLDRAKSDGRADYRLYIDRNCDGDLTNDTLLEGRVSRTFLGAPTLGSFGRVDLPVSECGVQKQRRVILNLRQDNGRLGFTCTDRGVYRGAFHLEGFSGIITLYDGNGDGAFGGEASSSASRSGPKNTPSFIAADRALLSDDGYGERLDIQPLGEHLWIGSALYRVKMDSARDCLILNRITRGLFPVKLPMTVERLTLFDLTRKCCLAVFRPSGNTILLPPGDYRLESYQAFRTDKNGECWRLNARGTGSSPVLNVKPGTPATLIFGEPFVPQLSWRSYSHLFYASLSMNFIAARGAGGEQIQTLETVLFHPDAPNPAFRRTIGRRPDAPAFTIVKSDGELVARGAFRYG